SDFIPSLDPARNVPGQFKLQVRDPKTASTVNDKIPMPSPYWGTEPIWDSQTIPHSLVYDHKDRIWFTSRIRTADNPAFCKQGSDHPSAKLFPLANSGRQISFYDTKSKKSTLISTCFSTQHLNFAEDTNHTLWISTGGGQGVVGWINTK